MVIGSEKCLDLLELKYYNDIVELKSEVIKCLHGQGDQKQKIRSQMISKSGLMMNPKKGLMNIARPTTLHGRRQYGAEYICFWRRNKNIGHCSILRTDSEPI